MRAIQQVLTFDRSRAVDLLGEVTIPSAPEGGCRDALAPDLSIYYETLAKVISGTAALSPERRRSLDDLLERSVYRTSYTSDVFAVAAMLARLQVPSQKFQDLLRIYASALDRMPGDFRSFIYFSHRRGDAMTALLETSARMGIPSGPLLASIRRFIVTNLSRPQCKDLVARLEPVKTAEPNMKFAAFSPASLSVVAAYNAKAGMSERSHSPIGIEDIPRNQSEDPPDDVRYFARGTGKVMLERLKDIMRRQQSPDKAPAGKPFEEIVEDFLGDLESWTAASGETTLDIYNEKSIIYLALFANLPSGAPKLRVLSSFLVVLEKAYAEIESKSDWFAPWHRLLIGSMLCSPEGNGAREALARSQNPVISGYEAFKRVTTTDPCKQ